MVMSEMAFASKRRDEIAPSHPRTLVFFCPGQVIANLIAGKGVYYKYLDRASALIVESLGSRPNFEPVRPASIVSFSWSVRSNVFLTSYHCRRSCAEPVERRLVGGVKRVSTND
jgi:hypothetical protein